MAPRYDHLAVTAMRVDTAAVTQRGNYCMRFPGQWKPPLRRLVQSTTGRDVVTIPIAPLNAAVTALVPDCIATLSYAGMGDADEDWLIAYREINPQALFTLVAAWVRAQNATAERITATLTELDPSQLAWLPVTVDLDTPEQRHRALRLLAMDAAAALSAPGRVCPHGDLTFRRCAADAGAELISWPPASLEERRPFSALITITAQTLPVSTEVIVNAHFGVRRWVHRRPNLSLAHGHNVYLDASLPYLSGLEHSPHFGRATIKRAPAKTADGETTYVTRWADPAASVLQEAGCLAQLPDPEQINADPMPYLQRSEHAAGLVYSTGMLDPERVSGGLAVADRQPLTNWVAETLAPSLPLIEPLPRVPTRAYPGLSRAVDPAKRAAALPRAAQELLGSRLDIELFTDTTESTSHALDALAGRLEVSMPAPAQLTDEALLVEVGPLTVGVRRPDASIATSLNCGPARTPRRVTEAVQTRVDEITAAVPRASHPTVALVEIGPPDSYEGSERGKDPFSAVRHGLAKTGRLSQFFNPAPEANRERFESSVDDLFRQLGVRPEELPQPGRNTIADRPALLAVWLVRKNKSRPWEVRRTIPVAVLIDPSGQRVEVHAPEMAWRPLHTGLLELAERSVDAANQSPEGITAFIRHTLDDTAGAYPDTLLVTHAQNLRNGWPALRNKNVELDVLAFGGERVDMKQHPGLRHVRVRTEEGHETPESFGVTDATSGLPGGLWRYRHERLYGSTGSKPASAAKAVLGRSKIVPSPYKDRLVAPNPNTQVWNHQFIELFVAGLQSGDDPDHWAAVAHELRRAAPYSKAATVLPWPLHLAKQVEEYLLPTRMPSEVATADSPE